MTVDLPHWNLKVLYVEDEAFVRDSMAKMLSRRTAQVMTAANGKEGLERFTQFSAAIDVVITDLEMPVMNGMEMIERIKSIASAKPVIVVTGYDDEAHKCPQAEITLIKPVTAQMLENALEQCARKLGRG